MTQDLPDYAKLADYEPPVVTRIHAGDGALLAEYATQKRLFMPTQAMPPDLIAAFLSAEDKSFYKHFDEFDRKVGILPPLFSRVGHRVKLTNLNNCNTVITNYK